MVVIRFGAKLQFIPGTIYLIYKSITKTMYQFDSLFAAFASLGIANGLVFGGYLLRQPRSATQVSNRYLGLFIFLLSLRFAITTVHYFYRSPMADWADWGLVLNLCLGPSFVVYVLSVFKMPPALAFSRLHLIPALVLLVLSLLGRRVISPAPFFEPFKDGWFLINQLTLLHWIMYLVYGYRFFLSQLAAKRAEGIDTRKVQQWMIGLLLLLSVLILGYSFNNARLLCVIFCPLFYTIIVYVILAFFIKNSTLFQKGYWPEGNKTSVLKPAKIPQIQEGLQKLLEDESVFLNPELTLDKLAQQLGISPHALSHYINTYEGYNFSDWLNRHRVEYACRLLLDPQYTHLKIAAVAFDSGFNTLSVFNGAFKKVVGRTPSEFRRQNG